MHKIRIGVRASGGGEYQVYYQLLTGPPVVVQSYVGSGRAESLLAHEQAEAHTQGLKDGMRLAANLIEGITP